MKRLKSAAVAASMFAIVALTWTATGPSRAEANATRLVAPPIVSQRAAWTMPAEYREVQRASLASQRAFLQAMADSMPEHHYGIIDNAGQRSFAGHVYHAAVANAQAVDRFIPGPDYQAPDETAAVSSRAALKAAVDSGFDYIAGLLDAQAEADRQSTMTFAGGEVPGWQFWDELNEHTYWTLGEIVGNFRALGMAPPAFRFF